MARQQPPLKVSPKDYKLIITPIITGECVYFMIPVKQETKKLIDQRKKELGAHTYDEAMRELARPKGLDALKQFEGILEGCPPFVRDKRDRVFV